MQFGISKIRNVVCVFILALGFQALTISHCLAAGETVTGVQGKSGSSTGTVVAAALETAGYVAQAKVLSQLSETLLSLGALIYLCCVISAIVTIALLGQYQAALWLLIGPPMFFFMIKPTESAAGVEWQFGIFDDQAKELDQILKGANISQKDGEKVSWLFHTYNVLISDSIQQLVGLITNEKPKKQMLFMTRQRIMDDMFASNLDDPNLLALTNLTFAQCSREMTAARMIGIGQRDPAYQNTPEYRAAVTTYCELMQTPNKKVEDGLKGYVLSLINDARPTDSNGKPDGPEQTEIGPVTCQKLWDWMFKGVVNAAKVNLDGSERQRVDSQAPNYYPEIYSKISSDIVDKLSGYYRDSDKSAPTFACAGAPSVAPPNNSELIPIIFAGWMIRKVYTDDPRSQMNAQVADHSGIRFEEATQSRNKIPSWREAAQEIQRRFRADQLAQATPYEIFSIAKSLPYVQGAGLFVLAAIFPFFAMMVLIPGQAGAFFTWMALWAWLKSWDVGWALIMVADELLWSIMPHSSFFRLPTGAAGGGGAYNAPVNVLEAAFAGDYAYNLSTYYMLIGMMMTAVPVITANAVMGSKKAIAGILVNGVKGFSQTFSGAANDWVAAEQIGESDRRREAFAVNYTKQHLEPHFQSLSGGRSEFNNGGITDAMMAKASKTISALSHGRIPVSSSLMPGANYTGAERAGGGIDLGAIPGSAKALFQSLTGDSAGAEQSWKAEAARSAKVDAQLGADYAKAEERWSKGLKSNKAFQYLQIKGWGSDTLIDKLSRGEMSEVVSTFTGSSTRFSPELTTEDIRRFNAVPGRAEADKIPMTMADPLTVNWKAPTPYFENYRKTIEKWRSTADYVGGAGELVSIAAVGLPALMAAAGGLLTATGVGAPVGGPLLKAAQVTGKYISPMGLGIGMAANTASLNMKRDLNSASADYLSRLSDYYYFESSRQAEWQMWDSVRAGVTGRVEWWNSPDAPTDAMAESVRGARELDLAGERNFYRFLGDSGMNVLLNAPLPTKGLR